MSIFGVIVFENPQELLKILIFLKDFLFSDL